MNKGKEFAFMKLKIVNVMAKSSAYQDEDDVNQSFDSKPNVWYSGDN